MEKDPNLAVTTLLEDFNARWQELLNFESDVSTWSTIYYTALFLTIAWVLGKRRQEVSELVSARDGVAPFLILSVALMNAAYILAISVKGYQIQQLGLYLYDVVGKRITEITGEPFNQWEKWRRTDPSRWWSSLYFVLVSLLPIGVSASILGSYWHFERPWRKKWLLKRNLFFYFALGVNIVVFVVTIYLSFSMYIRWRNVLVKS